MKSVRSIALSAFLALSALAPLASPPAPLPSPIAAAQAAGPRDATRTASTERWWGVVGAVTCAGAIKLALSLGPQPAVVSVAIAGCALAALDIITTKE